MACCDDNRWALPCDCAEEAALRHIHDCARPGCPKQDAFIADPPPSLTPSEAAEYWENAHRCPTP